jgi:hypothetical protein
LAADTGYGSAETLGWLVHERGIEPHIPVFDKSARKDGTFAREDFTYDHGADTHACPGGRTLTTTGTLVNDGATLIYRARKRDCALKPRCCPNAPTRKVPRSVYEGARDMARDIARTEAYAVSRRERKSSKCCLRTSNASSGWTACDCEGRLVPATSSTSPPPPRTSASWRS